MRGVPLDGETHHCIVVGHMTRLSMVYPELPSEKLPEPGVIPQEIIEDLESALAQLRGISEDLAQELPS